MVIGPERRPSPVNVQALHEYGGTQTVKNLRRRRRKIGSGGEIRVGGRESYTTKPIVDYRDNDVDVTYVRLRTAKQVARSNRINRDLYGPAGSYTVTYPPRPFMGPALAATLPSLPKFWAESVRST